MTTLRRACLFCFRLISEKFSSDTKNAFFAGAGSDILLFYELVIHDQSVMLNWGRQLGKLNYSTLKQHTCLFVYLDTIISMLCMTVV